MSDWVRGSSDASMSGAKDLKEGRWRKGLQPARPSHCSDMHNRQSENARLSWRLDRLIPYGLPAARLKPKSKWKPQRWKRNPIGSSLIRLISLLNRGGYRIRIRGRKGTRAPTKGAAQPASVVDKIWICLQHLLSSNVVEQFFFWFSTLFGHLFGCGQ